MVRVTLKIVDAASRHLIGEGEPERIARHGDWFEGPAWVGSTLVWSDVVGNRVLAWDRARGVRTVIEPSAFQNGHTVDRQGRLLAASHGERAIIRREQDGRWWIVADLFEGQRFNSPNDLVTSQDGAVWFTDPLYGLTKPDEGFGGEREISGQHVYRVDPFDQSVRCMTSRQPPMDGPNGIAFSPDESVLYVSDSERGIVQAFLVRYGLDGVELSLRWLVHEVSEGAPDGLRVDPAGRIWVAGGRGVEILSPPVVGQRSAVLGTIFTPKTTSNLAFTPDFSALALTSTDKVFLMPLGDVTR